MKHSNGHDLTTCVHFVLFPKWIYKKSDMSSSHFDFSPKFLLSWLRRCFITRLSSAYIASRGEALNSNSTFTELRCLYSWGLISVTTCRTVPRVHSCLWHLQKELHTKFTFGMPIIENIFLRISHRASENKTRGPFFNLRRYVSK